MNTQQTTRNRTQATRGRSLATVLASVAFAGLFLPVACGSSDSEAPGHRQVASRSETVSPEGVRPEPVPVPEPPERPASTVTPLPRSGANTAFLLGQREPAQQAERHV